MGRASKIKGKKGELEVAKILQTHGYDARRGVQYHGGPDSPDVVGLEGVHIEVKRCEKLNLYDAMDQSRRDAAPGEVPVVIHRRNGKEWLVVLSLEDYLEMYKRSGKILMTVEVKEK